VNVARVLNVRRRWSEVAHGEICEVSERISFVKLVRGREKLEWTSAALNLLMLLTR
jgi:hypothetical protein